MKKSLNHYLVGSLETPVVAEVDIHGWLTSSLARVVFQRKVWFYDLPENTSVQEFEQEAEIEFDAYCWTVSEYPKYGWMRVDLEEEPYPAEDCGEDPLLN